MKLMQINVWMGKVSGSLLKVIEREQPDVITAQEVFRADGPIVFPDNMFNLPEMIKAAGNYEYLFFAPVCDIAVAHQKVQLGNVVFSRFPISDERIVFTNGQYEEDLQPSNHTPNTRNAQFCTLDINQMKLNLINHHGHWEKTPEGSETGVARMQLIMNEIGKMDGPVIFSGDFNVNPGTETMKVTSSLLKDLTAEFNISSTLSVLGKVADVACDHILVNEQVHVSTFEVLDDIISDHKALVMEFTL